MSGASARLLAACATGLFVTIAACSSNTSTGASGNTSTTLVGVVADSTESGTITLTVGTGLSGALVGFAPVSVPRSPTIIAAVVSASGTLKLAGGSTISLSGTYDTGSGALSVSGGGYTLTGTYANGVLSGTFTGPHGSGGFSTQTSSSTNTATTYCGTWVATDGSNDHGVFNAVFTSGAAVAVAYSLKNASTFEGVGTVSGSSFTITGTVRTSNGTFTGTATGAISGSSVSGTFSSPDGHGTFSGAVCQ